MPPRHGRTRTAGPASAAAAVGCSYDSDDDGALVARLCAQDVAALGLLYDRYGGRVFAQALYILHRPELAEEVVQDAFLTLWRRATIYSPDRGSVRTWLLSVAHHRALDVLRRQRSRPQLVPMLDGNVPSTSDTAALVLHALTAAEVRGAIAMLPLPRQLCIRLAYFEGYTYPEIAERLQVPLGTVKSRIRLGLAQLRQTLMEPLAQPAVRA